MNENVRPTRDKKPISVSNLHRLNLWDKTQRRRLDLIVDFRDSHPHKQKQKNKVQNKWMYYRKLKLQNPKLQESNFTKKGSNETIFPMSSFSRNVRRKSWKKM